MKVKVESCWNGGDRHYFRLTFPCQNTTVRESVACVKGTDWDREYATIALNLLEHVYGITRRSVRFDVH
jgi:hypothetical protein